MDRFGTPNDLQSTTDCWKLRRIPAGGPKRFHDWCRPNPDFLWSLVVPSNCMRLSVKKAAHHYPRECRAQEIRASDRPCRGFPPRKPHLATFARSPELRNCFKL